MLVYVEEEEFEITREREREILWRENIAKGDGDSGEFKGIRKLREEREMN